MAMSVSGELRGGDERRGDVKRSVSGEMRAGDERRRRCQEEKKVAEIIDDDRGGI